MLEVIAIEVLKNLNPYDKKVGQVELVFKTEDTDSDFSITLNNEVAQQVAFAMQQFGKAYSKIDL